MKSEFKAHIRSIIGKLEIEDNSEVNGEINERMCFLKHYSGLSIEEEDVINIMASLNIDCDMFYYQFSNSTIQGAFCPFLTLIREIYLKYYSEMSSAEFVEKAGVYKALKNLFAHYIENGVCKRIENIIPEEIEYEQVRIIESIVSMIKYVSENHKLVFVLDRIQEAQESSVKLLLELIKRRELKNVVIIGTYNEAYSVNSYMKEIWNEMAGFIKKTGLAVECDEDIEEDISDGASFVPEAIYIDEYLRNIEDMYNCLVFNQAKYYLDIIYRAIEDDNLDVEAEKKIDILNLYALVTVLNGEEKVAYVYCKRMYDIQHIHRDKNRLFAYYFTNALISKQSGQIDMAGEMIEKARIIAEELQDTQKRVSINMLKMIVILDRGQDILLGKNEKELSEELINEAKDYNQKLHLAYAYIYGQRPTYDQLNSEENGKIGWENVPRFMEGIHIAEELGNVNLQIKAWQRCTIDADQAEVFYYYNKCLKIMEGHGYKHSEAQIYNGMGYNYLISERYDLAYEYFNNAISIGIEVETPQYILDAMYNLAVMGVIVGNYDSTIKYINVILKIMSALKVERLNVCNKSKLYGLMIFSYLKKHQIYDAKLYFDMMETALGHILSANNPNYSMWEDDMYLYYTTRGMIYMEEENYKEAKRSFKQLRELWQNIDSKQNYIAERVIEEQAKLYEITGDIAEREEILTEGIEFCENNNLPNSAKRLSRILNGIDVEENMNVAILDDRTIEKVIDIINKCEMKFEISQKNKLLDFFENWVDLLEDEFASTEEMISSAMLNIKNIFNIDGILYIKVENGIPEINYCDSEIELKKYQLKYICSFFNEYKRRILASRLEKSYKYHEELIAAFNREDIASIVAIPFINKDNLTEVFVGFRFQQLNYTENIKMLSEEEADVLRTAFKELMEAVNRENIKRQLEKNSVTDMLTGLYNRQGFGKCINEVLEKQKDGKKVKKILTMLYMDLDNFKYCNDNFGHDAGDAVLVAFSRMLDAIMEDDGFIIRYGGDEFLIIMPDRNADDGVEIAEKIFANLRHNKGFKKVLENIEHKEVDIEEKNRVTCSIGIASGIVSDYGDVTEILKKADEALYGVKKGTKHSYNVWNAQLQ